MACWAPKRLEPSTFDVDVLDELDGDVGRHGTYGRAFAADEVARPFAAIPSLPPVDADDLLSVTPGDDNGGIERAEPRAVLVSTGHFDPVTVDVAFNEDRMVAQAQESEWTVLGLGLPVFEVERVEAVAERRPSAAIWAWQAPE